MTTSTAPARIGVMGFGLLGRSLLRLGLDRPEFDVAAVADAADPEMLRYLLRYSTLPRPMGAGVALEGDDLCVAGHRARVLRAAGAEDVPWGDLGIETVVDFRDPQPARSELEAHLASGAKRVVCGSPPAGGLDRAVVVGLNDASIEPSDRIVSAGSAVAHCAGPLLGILARAFGVEKAFVSTVRAWDAGSRLADVPATEMRSGRAAGENIIPIASAAAAELEAVLPGLSGRLSASSMQVPVSNGSVVDLVCWHRDPVSVASVNEVVAASAGSEWAGRVRFEREPIVSADTEGAAATCIFDSLATMALGERVSKTVAWFDNGWGYLHRLLELFAALESSGGGSGAEGGAS